MRENSLLEILEKEKEVVAQINFFEESKEAFLLEANRNSLEEKESALRFAKIYEEKARNATEELAEVRGQMKKHLLFLLNCESAAQDRF